MPLESAEFVPVAEGLAVAVPTATSVDDWEGFDLTLTIGAIPAKGSRVGRLVCQELTVRQRDGGPPVTSEAIRSMPVATLMRHAGLNSLLTANHSSNGDSTSFSPFELTSETAERLRALGPARESLEWVARIYRLALVLREPPTRTVETTFRLPRSTAGRWVALAREQGLLGAAEGPGKAGG